MKRIKAPVIGPRVHLVYLPHQLTRDGADPVMNNAHHLIANKQQWTSFTNAIVHNRVCVWVNFSILKNVLFGSFCWTRGSNNLHALKSAKCCEKSCKKLSSHYFLVPIITFLSAKTTFPIELRLNLMICTMRWSNQTSIVFDHSLVKPFSSVWASTFWLTWLFLS